MEEEQIDRLLFLQEELLRWNQRINLTAITDPMEILEKHLLDSLSLVPHIPSNARVLDVGSGGGFPGLPLKIARPDLRIVSVDSVGKKIRFQQHMVRTLGLVDFSPKSERIENLILEGLDSRGFDVIVSRAFSHLFQFVQWVSPLAIPSTGQIIAMKGPEGIQEAEESREELTTMGWDVIHIREFSLPESESRRTLIVLGQI